MLDNEAPTDSLETAPEFEASAVPRRIGTATYSPDDNKLRLYPRARLDAETYARVKAAGFKWAPRQDLFVAPMWTPGREDLLLELCDEIDDEDTSLAQRAEERAERFEEYHGKRTADAERAQAAVAGIVEHIPLGQPILVGHHSERRARNDAERIKTGMRKAVRMWDTAAYWRGRAAGALAHAKYKELPAVRARRIKTIGAERRKLEHSIKDCAEKLALWSKEGLTLEQARVISNVANPGVRRREGGGYADFWTAWDVLRPDEERYAACPAMSVEDVQAAAKRAYTMGEDHRARWLAHYDNRLTYERAMLEEAGGLASDRVRPEVGGAVKCLWGPRGGWAYIRKVNKVTVTLEHQWSDGGRVFKHNEPLDKLREIMTRAQVEAARAEGRLKEASSGVGFWLLDAPPELTRTTETPADPAADMRAALRAGVKVAAVPQLFPTPRSIAERMAALLDLKPGQTVLEPSAGTGMLIGACGCKWLNDGQGVPAAERGAFHAVEINVALAGRLQAESPLTTVHNADFLTVAPGDILADRVIMNPPFERGADIHHIKHALTMLKPGGRLVALCANGPRQTEALKPLASHWEPLPAGSFAEQGTAVNVALLVIDV